MKQRLALAAMLGGSLTFLVSLYFEWLSEVDCGFGSCRSPYVTTYAWNGLGQIAAALAIGLAAGAIAAATNPERAMRLPLGRMAVALGIFAVLSVSELWTNAIYDEFIGSSKIAFGPGAYAGLGRRQRRGRGSGRRTVGRDHPASTLDRRRHGDHPGTDRVLRPTRLGRVIRFRRQVRACCPGRLVSVHLRIRLSRASRVAATETGAAARDGCRCGNACRRRAVAVPIRLRLVAVRALARARLRGRTAGARPARRAGSAAPTATSLRAWDRCGEPPPPRFAVPALAFGVRRALLLGARLVKYAAFRDVRARRARGARLVETLRRRACDRNGTLRPFGRVGGRNFRLSCFRCPPTSVPSQFRVRAPGVRWHGVAARLRRRPVSPRSGQAFPRSPDARARGARPSVVRGGP